MARSAASGSRLPASGSRRGPLVLDTRELGRRPGSMRRLRLQVPAPDSLRVELIGVPVGAPVDLSVRLEAVVEGVLVSADVIAPMRGECCRCLEPVENELEVSFQELYAYPDSTTSETTDDETPQLDGDLLDLEPELRDAIVLALPMTPLCRADCAGLCASCGQRLEPGEPPHDHPVTDPRWAALRRFSGSQAADHAPNQALNEASHHAPDTDLSTDPDEES